MAATTTTKATPYGTTKTATNHNAAVVEEGRAGRRIGNADAVQVAQVTSTKKVGHVCCGFCCDVRRAVIIINLLAAILAIIGVILFATAVGIYGNFDDEDIEINSNATEVTEDLDWEYGEWAKDAPLREIGLGVGISWAAIAILFYFIGLIGAIKYSACLVLLSCLFYAAAIIWAILFFDVISAVINLLFLYPHIVLYSEIKKGIMAPETYKVRERHSCCCF